MYNIKRGPKPGELYHPKGRGNGYVLTYGGKRFYISGDTENIPEMRALKNIDVAFVCMNLPYTMPVEEAAEAVKAFHPKMVYPYHYKGQDTKKFAELLKGTASTCGSGIGMPSERGGHLFVRQAHCRKFENQGILFTCLIIRFVVRAGRPLPSGV